MLLSHSFNRMSLGLLYQQHQRPVNNGLLRGGAMRVDSGQTFSMPPPTPLPPAVFPSPPAPMQFAVGTQPSLSPAAPHSLVVSQPTPNPVPAVAPAAPTAEIDHTAPPATAPLIISPDKCCTVVDNRQCKNKWSAPEVVIGNQSFKICGQHKVSHGKGSLRAVFDGQSVPHNVGDLTAAAAAGAPAAPAAGAPAAGAPAVPAVPAAASSAEPAPAVPITTPASGTTPDDAEDEEEYKSAE